MAKNLLRITVLIAVSVVALHFLVREILYQYSSQIVSKEAKHVYLVQGEPEKSFPHSLDEQLRNLIDEAAYEEFGSVLRRNYSDQFDMVIIFESTERTRVPSYMAETGYKLVVIYLNSSAPPNYVFEAGDSIRQLAFYTEGTTEYGGLVCPARAVSGSLSREPASDGMRVKFDIEFGPMRLERDHLKCDRKTLQLDGIFVKKGYFQQAKSGRSIQVNRIIGRPAK